MDVLFQNIKGSGHFRVVLFGSSRIKKEDQLYKDIFKFGREIGERGFDIVTGGGPGTMEAGNLGHSEFSKEARAHSFGLNIKLPFEQKLNDGVNVSHEHERFSTRLDEFMSLAHIVVVADGGIGTLLELFYTWQLIQAKHIHRIPLILVGPMWKELLIWMEKFPLKNFMIDDDDLKIVKCVDNFDEALSLVDKWYAIYSTGVFDATSDFDKLQFN